VRLGVSEPEVGVVEVHVKVSVWVREQWVEGGHGWGLTSQNST
jgi:hypothetical protein